MRAATLATLAATAALCGCSGGSSFDRESQIGPNPNLPEQKQYLVPPMHLAPVVGWKSGEAPNVAPGLSIRPLATDLSHPRNVYPLPNGDVLVVESKGPGTEPVERPKDLVMNWVESFVTGGGSSDEGATGETNRITLIRDANGDGEGEGRSVLLRHLNSPFGVVYADGYLYVAATDAILRYPFTPGQTLIDAPATVLAELPAGPIDHHWTKSLTISPDGSTLYVGVGSNSNVTENGREAERGRAAIWQVDRATGAQRIFASGLRNPNGLTFEPATGQLWAVVNERDELGPNLVPDYLTSVKPGAFYGWPYSYYGQHVDPRVHPQNPALVAKAIAPDYALSSHVAPLGLTFNTGSALPARYAGGAFIGEHGSWDRPGFNGYRVVFVPFQGGRPSGKTQDVVTGFLNADNKARGRPVGVAMDRTGALLIADDVGDTVWRVTAAR